ncbi:CHC2 zinc finger domain-containing protein [Knoellia sp. CPCC 206450]|uniref:CHC2 zinc finger domain-containing protein n=1 Tax=Knoellia tibetensis TaxID=3404798 RepID=UPI003B4362AB
MTRAEARVDVEVLRSRHPLPAVVESTGVALRPTGRGFIGCCPFHDDSTASFSVDGVPDRYHCFGCGASGDVIDYVARLKGLSFLDAVASLETGGFPAAAAHPRQGMAASVEPPNWPTRPRAHEIHELAWAYFTRPVAHATAAAYLRRQRGIDVRDLESALGRSVVGLVGNGWTSLTDHLTGQGVSIDELLALDLVRTSSRGTVIDALRSRIVLPVMESDTHIRGFLARDTTGHPRVPKYLNPTRTVVFDKSKTLYRADHRETPPQATTVVVEGPLDALAIACASATAGNLDALRAVSTGGTSVSRHQVDAIASAPGFVVVALDADTAGINATHRLLHALDRHPRPPARVLVAQLPSGGDPASWLAPDLTRVLCLDPDTHPGRGGPRPVAEAVGPSATVAARVPADKLQNSDWGHDSRPAPAPTL